MQRESALVTGSGHGRHDGVDILLAQRPQHESLGLQTIPPGYCSGNARTLNLPASSGWTRREFADVPLSTGTATATVTIRAASGNGYLFADGLGLVTTVTARR